MESEHRIGLLGLGVAALAVAAPQLKHLPSAFADLSGAGPTDVASVVAVQQRDRELMLDRDFDVRTGGTLSVSVPDADVEVRVGDNDRASVRIFMTARDRDWGRELFERMEFDARLSGNELRVVSRNPRFDRSEWRSNRGGVGFLVEITVPREYNTDISTSDGDITVEEFSGTAILETSDGDITAEALAGSDINLKTSDGDITAGTLSGSDITLETSDGNINAESLTCEALTVHTSDGDIRLRDLAGAARVSTGDGDIQIHIREAGELNLRTGDGDITIYADRSLSANLDLDGESVDLGSGFSLSGRVSRHGARGSLNGGGPTIQAHTGDGSIVVRERRGGR